MISCSPWHLPYFWSPIGPRHFGLTMASWRRWDAYGFWSTTSGATYAGLPGGQFCRVNSPDEIRPGNDPSGPNIPTMQKNVEKNISNHSKHIIKCEENRGIAIPRNDELIFKIRVGTPLNHQANECVASAKGVCFRWNFGHSSTSFYPAPVASR